MFEKTKINEKEAVLAQKHFTCAVADPNRFQDKILISGPLFRFSPVQTHITLFTTNICEKCPSSIRC